MNVPDDRRFLKSHEWIETGKDDPAVGITDHAQSELSDVVFVDPPQVGDTLEEGAAAAVVESVKAASDIYAPVAGEITAVNTDLETNPGLINTDPFGEGWIFKIKPTDPADLEKLLTPEAYREQIS
ncbi:MAG: glycine cleavage system protein GcvH [Verrucomicrobiota bacterium]